MSTLRFAHPALLALAFVCVTVASAKTPVLEELATMPVEGVKGEFDHFAIDLAGHRLYLAAEDQKTVEVFDLTTRKHVQSISLFSRPHGLIFFPGSSTLMVADGGDGTCKFIDTGAGTPARTPTISSQVKTALRADSVAYDPTSSTALVTNGGLVAKMDYSLVTAISAASPAVVGEVKIDSKILEAMAVEKGSSRLFINSMDKNNVTVVDRMKWQILGSWPLSAAQPSAMALDEPHHRLFVACRKPGRLIVLNTQSGKEVTSLPSIGHADDAYYDPATRRIYVSGGEGAVSVYQESSPDAYTLLDTVETGPGAKTSLFVSELKQLFVAVPSSSSQPAKVIIFAAGK